MSDTPPAFMRKGTAVLYQPFVHPDEPAYAGTIATDPWQLGNGTWVCHLDMGEDYKHAFGKTRVHAAWAGALQEVP